MNLTTARYAVAGGVATLTLDRPEARNALNRAMCDDILAATAAAHDDAEVRLVLIRATGPVFCAGADLKERKGMAPDEVRARRLAAYAAYGAIENLPMPAIAIVHGAAVGSGCDIDQGLPAPAVWVVWLRSGILSVAPGLSAFNRRPA